MTETTIELRGGDGDVVLVIKYKGVDIQLNPEYPQQLCDLDINSISGKFDTNPSNGLFSLSWSPQNITLSVGKFGDGYGGSLDVVIPATPQLLSELRSALNVWKGYLLNSTCDNE